MENGLRRRFNRAKHVAKTVVPAGSVTAASAIAEGFGTYFGGKPATLPVGTTFAGANALYALYELVGLYRRVGEVDKKREEAYARMDEYLRTLDIPRAGYVLVREEYEEGGERRPLTQEEITAIKEMVGNLKEEFRIVYREAVDRRNWGLGLTIGLDSAIAATAIGIGVSVSPMWGFIVATLSTVVTYGGTAFGKSIASALIDSLDKLETSFNRSGQDDPVKIANALEEFSRSLESAHQIVIKFCGSHHRNLEDLARGHDAGPKAAIVRRSALRSQGWDRIVDPGIQDIISDCHLPDGYRESIVTAMKTCLEQQKRSLSELRLIALSLRNGLAQINDNDELAGDDDKKNRVIGELIAEVGNLILEDIKIEEIPGVIRTTLDSAIGGMLRNDDSRQSIEIGDQEESERNPLI